MQELLLTTDMGRVIPPWPEGIPGPQNLITGNDQIGFFGETTSTEFITYLELAAAVGVTTGTALTDNGWLKVAYKGNIQFIAKTSVRNNLSWATMNSLGIVSASQNKLIDIKGKIYRVRLINGCNTDPYTGTDDNAGGTPTHGTEWNYLIYGLARGVSPLPTLEGPPLANYNASQIGLAPASTGGSVVIKEIGSGNATLVRGNAGGAIYGLFRWSTINNQDNARGWKPVLEYVSG